MHHVFSRSGPAILHAVSELVGDLWAEEVCLAVISPVHEVWNSSSCTLLCSTHLALRVVWGLWRVDLDLLGELELALRSSEALRVSSTNVPADLIPSWSTLRNCFFLTFDELFC